MWWGLWGDLPIGRAVRLVGASPAALTLTLVPLPPDAPAIVVYRPAGARSKEFVVAEVLDELETAAIDLFPTWLPVAEGIRSPGGGGGVAAVRVAAERLALVFH